MKSVAKQVGVKRTTSRTPNGSRYGNLTDPDYVAMLFPQAGSKLTDKGNCSKALSGWGQASWAKLVSGDGYPSNAAYKRICDYGRKAARSERLAWLVEGDPSLIPETSSGKVRFDARKEDLSINPIRDTLIDHMGSAGIEGRSGSSIRTVLDMHMDHFCAASGVSAPIDLVLEARQEVVAFLISVAIGGTPVLAYLAGRAGDSDGGKTIKGPVKSGKIEGRRISLALFDPEKGLANQKLYADEPQTITIGRKTDSDYRIPSSCKAVAREHAWIERTESGSWLLRQKKREIDMTAVGTDGSYTMMQSPASLYPKPIELRSGDRILLAPYASDGIRPNYDNGAVIAFDIF